MQEQVINTLTQILIKIKKKESYIISLDENSLYASAMCYELQYGEIKFDHNTSKYTNEHIFNLNPYG